jgi:hypothetical protein
MIREFLGFAFLVFAFLGLLSWWIHFNKRSSSQGEPESIDQHDGSLPDSFFDTRTSDSSKERNSELLPARENKSEVRR